MKFRAHETFAIRKGWLHKGMRHVVNNPKVFIDKNTDPMVELGLGKNMVKALRYWLQATGLTYEDKKTRNQYLTPFGHSVWDNDKYIEEDGTLYLIHYFLVTNKELVPSWYYFFNLYQAIEITKENYIDSIKQYLNTEDEVVAERSLYDDFDCIVKTYISNSVSSSPENNTDCPFSELQLLGIIDVKDKIYVKKTPHSSVISPYVILAVMLNERKKEEDNNKKAFEKANKPYSLNDIRVNDIKITKLEKQPCNIGKVFNMDSMQIASYLDKLQNMGYLRVIRTAGLDVVTFTTDLLFNDIVEQYYESING